MVDFAGEYFMGAERFYQYYQKQYVDELLKQVGFKIKSFHKEGGDMGNKWLVYVVVKN